MKDSRSILMLLLTAGLVTTWVYHLYDKSNYSSRTKEVFVKDSTAIAEAVSDSLRKYYSRTLDQLGSEKMLIDSANNTLKGELGARINEINKLRNEIGTILKRRNLTKADLDEAKNKINDLQQRIDDLKSENTSLADERKRLNSILAQLNGDMNALQQNMQKISAENKELSQRVNDASTFIASELKFAAYNLRQDQKETETAQQKRADKFVASFVLQNNVAEFQNAEIMVIIQEPSGKTLNTEVWDVGSFDTRTEGKKVYTRKIKFEYKKGEVKPLLFSISPEAFEKGIYKLMLYHNGVRIGESFWKLS
jgi:uncharacterized phage infection (PIP) family protein YhgE